MKLTQKQLQELGHITLEDFKESLREKVDGERAMEVANELMKPMIDGIASYTPQEFTAGCVMALMKVLAAAGEVMLQKEDSSWEM